MPTLRIDKRLKKRAYFLTLTTINWTNIFTSIPYCNAVIKTLRFYQGQLNLKIYGYIIMPNHIHLISQCNDMISFVSRFKSYLTRKIKILLYRDKQLHLLKSIQASARNKKSNKFKIFQDRNWPVLVESEDFFNQKLEYIHMNPVIKGYAANEEDWFYSSARNYILNDNSTIFVETDGKL